MLVVIDDVVELLTVVTVVDAVVQVVLTSVVVVGWTKLLSVSLLSWQPVPQSSRIETAHTAPPLTRRLR